MTTIKGTRVPQGDGYKNDDDELASAEVPAVVGADGETLIEELSETATTISAAAEEEETTA